MKIGLLQFSQQWENKDANKKRIINLLSKVENTDLLIFPELTLTGFTMKSMEFAEELSGETYMFYSGLAIKHKTNLIGGIIENEPGNYFNTLLYINSNGEIISKYRKIHPFSFSEEDKNFTGGDSPVISEINGWKTGFSICYDLRFPELFRQYGKERVELIVNIANWPDTRIDHWRTLLKARAIENQCYVCAVNRVGGDPKLNYNGYSSIYDPTGVEILSCENEERVLVTNIDKKLVDSVRNKFPFLGDIKLI